MSIESIRVRRPEPYGVEAEPGPGTASADKKRNPAGEPARAPSQGKDSLLRAHARKEAADVGRFARADAEKGRVAAALNAIRPLAQAVGADAAAFAAQYAAPAHAGKSPAEIRAEASFAFVRDVLARRPDQADSLIAARLRGLGDDTRALARAALKESRAVGAARYAACEQALGKLQGLDGEARRDVLGMVNAGTPFAQAVQAEKKELAGIAAAGEKPPAPVSTAELKRQAVANARAQADAVRKLSAGVQRTLFAIGKVSRFSEAAAGVGAAAGTLGSGVVAAGESALKRSSAPLAKAAHDAERAGGFIVGELSAKIHAADRTAVKLLEAAGRYETVFGRRIGAIQSGDHAAALETAKQLDALAGEIKALGESLAGQAKSIGKLNRDFDGAAEHAALSVALAGLGYAVGSQPALHHGLERASAAVGTRVAPTLGSAAGRAAAGASEIGIHAGVEGGVARGYGAVRH